MKTLTSEQKQTFRINSLLFYILGLAAAAMLGVVLSELHIWIMKTTLSVVWREDSTSFINMLDVMRAPIIVIASIIVPTMLIKKGFSPERIYNYGIQLYSAPAKEQGQL